jgi:hypothetical protein
VNPWRATRILARVTNFVVLVVSGAYLLVYLYRWEWNRAVISGIFFIAAEIALATSLLLDAIRRRSSQAAVGPAAATGAVITEANHARPARHFSWLARRSDRLGVFIPVLLGAGVILSGLAYLVERLAAGLAGPLADRRSAAQAPLALPLGSGFATDAPARNRPGPRARALARTLGWLVLAATAALAIVATVDVLADATQSRPAPAPLLGTTEITLLVEQKQLARPPEQVAEALWLACRTTAPYSATLVAVDRVDRSHARLVVEPALGDLQRRRVFGCLGDATLDRVRASVAAWSAR